MTTGPIVLTRDALYKQVWATPLRKIAEEYGISDVALAKICRKLNVPVPGRGHWAKVAAGQSMQVRPLPRVAMAQTATIAPKRLKPERPPEDVLPQASTVAAVGLIEVPHVIGRSHPLTVKTRNYYRDMERRILRHAKRRPGAAFAPGDWPPSDDHGRYACFGGHGYHLTVSLATLERALGLLDTLVKALATHGFRFSFNEPKDRGYERRGLSGLVAVKDGEELHWYMREGYNRRERLATELAAAKKAYEYLTKYENLPNGSLTLELSGTQHGTGETFRDTRSVKLEAELGRIVAACIDAVPRQKQLREEREARQRAEREAEHRRWIDRERVRQEKEEVESLLKEAERARQFDALREYLDHLEKSTLARGGMSEEGRAWLADARRLLAVYDPAQVRLGHAGHQADKDADEYDED